MTTTFDHPATASRTFTTGTRVLLVGAPLLMAVARVLLVPMDDQALDTTLTHMADHAARSNLGWFLAMVASGLLATTAVVLAQRVHAVGRARAAMAATITIVLGWTGCAAICLGGLFMAAAAKAPDRLVQVQVQKDFNNGNAAFPFLLCLIGVVGYIVLAVALARGGTASKGAAVLVAVGGAATLLTMPGPLAPLLVLTALMLAAGHILVLRTASRHDLPSGP